MTADGDPALAAEGREALRPRGRKAQLESSQLRPGWTTGACACAAATSAFVALETGEFPDPVGIALPGGREAAFALTQWSLRPGRAMAAVTKDAGDDPDVTHVDGKIDPAGDIETIATELILADIQTLEKAVPRLEKEVRGKKTDAAVLETARAALGLLGEGIVLSAAVASGAADRAGIDVDVLRTFQLMTTKPIIYVFNMDDAGMSDEARQAELRELVAPAEAVFLDAQFEAELVELEPDEAAELLHDNGQEESGLDKLARVGFDTLGLQTYLTAGEKESRAWTIRRGMTAPQAAGVIHTDFERGFIKAEIVSYDDLMEYGSVAEARAHGRVRMEGKDYVMRDGDVVEFRFNV